MAQAVEQVKTVDPRSQYLAAPGYGPARGPRRLPDYRWDEYLDTTPETYRHMSCDPEIAAALRLVIYFVLADGIQLSPAVGDKDPKFERATQIKEQLERTIAGLQRPLTQTLEMILEAAMEQGNKIAEKNYYIPTDGPDANNLILESIKVKPRGSASFVVDEYWNLLGLVPARAYVRDTLSQELRLIPAEKFVIATWRMQDEDPRGQSFYRSVVKAWKIKQLQWPEFLTYLMRCAIPGLVGMLAENSKDEELRHPDGSLVTDPDTGRPIKVRAAQVMLDALIQFKNSTAMAVDHGAEVKPLEVKGSGEVFEKGFSIVNREIRKGLLLQELATSDSEHQTKGSTASQMGIVDLLVRATKTWLADLIHDQILKDQVRYNFGEAEARELTPVVSLGDYDRRDWSVDAEAVVKLVTAKILDEAGGEVNALTYSQIQSLFVAVGLPAPTDEELNEMKAQAEERRKAREQAMKQGQAPGQPVKPGEEDEDE